MSKRKRRATAVTIAGSDSGGGAGIQADLKTFAALNVHGTTAITCITAQNPKAVLGIAAIRPALVEQQLEAIFSGFQPRAVKTGMLFSSEIISVVATFLRGRRVQLIVDPVMIATSGASLLKPSAVRALEEKLLPLATLVTPNLDEAEALVGEKIRSLEDLRASAKRIYQAFGCAALVKGGHLPGAQAVDFFCDGKREFALRARFIKGASLHGSGCTYSAAITAYLTLGHDLLSSIQLAKKFITRRFRSSEQLSAPGAELNRGKFSL
ncbi:MAG: bifunctional hydroxymethylpyrimidine kinase/phosphomethylpyrimidine kinase [Verrucomicrobiota bacterium]